MRRRPTRPSGHGRAAGRAGAGTSVGILVAIVLVIAVIGAGSRGASNTAEPASTAAASPSASDTAAPSFTAAAPSDPATAEPAPAPPPDVVPDDPCHAGGVSYCVLNPAVTQATIGSTICVSGWTRTVRPSESYTENLKREQIAAEGLPGGMSSYEEDHRMPLELGGAPSDPANLSPESPPSPNPKDSAENALKREVCSGQLSLAAAQQQLVATWLAAYPGYRR